MTNTLDFGHDTGPDDVTFEVLPALARADDPIQLPTIDFLRRFEVSELAAFNALRKTVASLTPADYAAAASGDEAKAALVGFEVFLTFYDALSGLIEIDHPQTVAGLELLVPLGVLAPERLGVVLGREVAS